MNISLVGEGIVQVSQGARSRIACVDIDARRFSVTNPSSVSGYNLDAVHKARLLVETTVAQRRN